MNFSADARKSCNGERRGYQFVMLLVATQPARWIQLLNKTENAPQPKLSRNSRKTLVSYKTRENAFDKTLEKSFFGKFSVSFRTIFGKVEKSTENLGKMILV